MVCRLFEVYKCGLLFIVGVQIWFVFYWRCINVVCFLLEVYKCGLLIAGGVCVWF